MVGLAAGCAVVPTSITRLHTVSYAIRPSHCYSDVRGRAGRARQGRAGQGSAHEGMAGKEGHGMAR